MCRPPSMAFFAYNDPAPLDAGHPLWSAALPMGPNPFPSPGPHLTYGDYFTAVGRYLSSNTFFSVRSALSAGYDRIRSVDVRLEKHGAFYHPAHVTVETDAGPVHRVLNVAASVVGLCRMDIEVAALMRLARHPAAESLPRVFHAGSADTPSGRTVRMFLAEWFDGYSEFHLTIDPRNGRQKWVLWDTEAGNRILTPRQAAAVYQGASRILTELYDIDSAEQVRFWNHAAGDFVVRIDGNAVSVKLVTVRDYAASGAMPFDETDPDSTRLMNLLLFLTELSLRSRIDRFDGTGEWGWAGRAALKGTVRGFFDGLVGRSQRFRSWAAGFTSQALYAILSALLEGYHPESPERRTALRRLKPHARDLAALLASERALGET
ncbi:MAG: hypothetical protein ACOWWM_01685 [Desulfobacterales bacterium]